MTASLSNGPILGLGYADVAGTVLFSAVDGPGNRYVVFFQGCGWDCLACHNPATIPLHPKGMRSTDLATLVDGIADAAPFLTGVTITGGEPTQQPEALRRLLTALAADPRTTGLSRFLNTNGDVPVGLWDRLAPVLDGVMLDLKSIDPERHVVLTGHGNRRTLASMVRLAGLGLLYEVRLLLVPGLNDDDDQLTRTAHWLLALDPRIRVRVNGFRRMGTRACARDLLEVTADDRERYREVLTAAGITDLTV